MKVPAARTRVRVEAVAAAVTGVLALVTLVVPDWIEALTGADPDHGDGAVEVAVVLGLAGVTLLLATLALVERRHAARVARSSAPPPSPA